MSKKATPEWLEKSSCIFYKLMVDSIIQAKKLRIPSKFTRKYGSELSSIATLTGPNGRVWIVELEKVNHELWFNKGWHEFVEYYSIQIGYFLVFRYEEKSNFNVHLFNLSACEIKDPCNALCGSQKLGRNKECQSNYMKETNSYNEEKILYSCTPEPLACSYLANEEYKHGNGVYNTKREFQSNGDIGVPFGTTELYLSAVETEYRTKKIRYSIDAGSEDQYQLFDVPLELLGPEDYNPAFPKRGRVVTPEQKERTLKVASMYRPENPSCTIILRPSYVYKGLLLHLPRRFARLYLKGVSGVITLLCREKQWLVRCVCINGNAKLSSGWPEFVWQNNLEEGDVCVFEMIDTKNIVLKVTLFRVVEVAGSVNCLQQ